MVYHRQLALGGNSVQTLCCTNLLYTSCMLCEATCSVCRELLWSSQGAVHTLGFTDGKCCPHPAGINQSCWHRRAVPLVWGCVRSASQLPALLTNYPLKCVSCSFVLVSLYAILSHHTVTSFLGLCEHSLPPSPGGRPARSSKSLISLSAHSALTPGCPEHTDAYCSHPPLSPPKPEAFKSISLAAHNRTANPLCVAAWIPFSC